MKEIIEGKRFPVETLKSSSKKYIENYDTQDNWNTVENVLLSQFLNNRNSL